LLRVRGSLAFSERLASICCRDSFLWKKWGLLSCKHFVVWRFFQT
jgi:hypothetical protein